MLFIALDWPGIFLCCCSISITTSCYPLPSICFRDPVSDWFESLAECLHWNVRKKQNNFVEEEFWESTSNDSWEWKVAVSLLYAFKVFANVCGHHLRHIYSGILYIRLICWWLEILCYFLSSRKRNGRSEALIIVMQFDEFPLNEQSENGLFQIGIDNHICRFDCNTTYQ